MPLLAMSIPAAEILRALLVASDHAEARQRREAIERAETQERAHLAREVARAAQVERWAWYKATDEADRKMRMCPGHEPAAEVVYLQSRARAEVCRCSAQRAPGAAWWAPQPVPERVGP